MKHLTRIITPPGQRECHFCREQKEATVRLEVVQGNHATVFYFCASHFAQFTEDIIGGKEE